MKQQNIMRTKLARIAEISKGRPKEVFTSIYHFMNKELKYIIKKTNEKLRGDYQYFGITDNSKMLEQYYLQIKRLIFKWLNRRSQRKSYNYEQFEEMLKIYPLVNGIVLCRKMAKKNVFFPT